MYNTDGNSCCPSNKRTHDPVHHSPQSSKFSHKQPKSGVVVLKAISLPKVSIKKQKLRRRNSFIALREKSA